MKIKLLTLSLLLFVSCQTAQQKFMQVEIFPSQEEHAHGGTIVELPNGDMLAAWFQGHGERWADDVRIMGARLLKGEESWTKPFLMADVPEFPDINPVLFIDQQETLWLVWYTVIANQWSTSLPKYRTSTNYMQKSGPPEWDWQDVIHFKPGNKTEKGIQPNDKFVKSVEKQVEKHRKLFAQSGVSEEQLKEFEEFAEELLTKSRGEDMIKGGDIFLEDGTRKSAQLGYPYFRRMGWQTKNKPLQIGNRIIIPFYSDGLDLSIMAITDDFGQTWKFSTPLVGIGNIQPTMAFKKDGTIVAYMRDNGPPPNRHPVSESKDNGLTWSLVADSELPNSGSGSDIVTLKNGHWVIAYNDTEEGRYTLAVSLSEDEGKTWKYNRHLELDLNEDKGKRNKAAYPSIIQGKDGMIHVVYSYHKHHKGPGDDDTIKYIRFQEDWIKDGD
ncbi:MAG: exo-alpha-sialidase [Bacteroidota bacterium]